MSSSYKPALLKALVRIVRRGCDERIALTAIGHEFVSLYWVQTVVFRLRQAATVEAQPEVVRRIRSTADVTRVRDLVDLPSDVRVRLDVDMSRVLKINVLQAFHTSKPPSMAPLFTWTKGDAFVTMTDAARSFVATNAEALEAIANLWWARQLERVNLLAPLIIEKVERDGAKRGSLAKYLGILRQTDESRCFYCERAFGEPGRAIHVDHVIPWSFLLADPLWNLVLACAPCNLGKSDSLPDRTFVSGLARANARRARFALPPNVGSPLLTEDEMGRYFDAAISVEWPSGWTP